MTNIINGDDPLIGAITTGAGAWAGYSIGNYIVKPTANLSSKWLTGGWDPKFNPELLKYTEVKGQFGISNEMLPNKTPGAIGNVSGSFSSEYGSYEAQKIIDKVIK